MGDLKYSVAESDVGVGSLVITEWTNTGKKQEYVQKHGMTFGHGVNGWLGGDPHKSIVADLS